MPNEIFYVFDDRKCKAEGLTKEQILNAIYEATGVMPTDVDEGFITTIVETNKNRSIHIWKGTQAEYNALETHDPLTYYIIDDDSTIDDIESDLADLQKAVNETPWCNITKTNIHNVEEIVGRYKIIGKCVYCQINIVFENFADNKVYLPVQLDVAGSGLTFPFYDSAKNPGIAIIAQTSINPPEIISRITFNSVSKEHPVANCTGFMFNAIIRAE